MALIQAKFVHTNLIARDWRRLSAFYETVFGCRPVPPERDYNGLTLEAGTGIPGARVRGVHLLLPGWGEDGPTLEIFSYTPEGSARSREIHGLGFGHIAFSVADVRAAHAAVLDAGGLAGGEIVTLSPGPGLSVTWCYVRDPEGNFIELQTQVLGQPPGSIRYTGPIVS